MTIPEDIPCPSFFDDKKKLFSSFKLGGGGTQGCKDARWLPSQRTHFLQKSGSDTWPGTYAEPGSETVPHGGVRVLIH
jgi:hypothetical protein